MDYCKRLKELRIKNGYTQEQIAFILHTRQEQYSKYESGKRELPILPLPRLRRLHIRHPPHPRERDARPNPRVKRSLGR